MDNLIKVEFECFCNEKCIAEFQVEEEFDKVHCLKCGETFLVSKPLVLPIKSLQE